MVELLCQHGASITALDAQLSSALDRAIGARQVRRCGAGGSLVSE